MSSQLLSSVLHSQVLAVICDEIANHFRRRQYVFQFEKWGLRKYGIDSMHSILPSQPPLDLKADQEMELDAISQRSVIINSPTKRQQSLQSLQSGRSLNSLRVKPPVPPKKRQKLVEFMASKEMILEDPYKDLGLAFDNQTTSRPMPRSPISSGQTACFSRGTHSTSWEQTTIFPGGAFSSPSTQTAIFSGGTFSSIVNGQAEMGSLPSRREDDNASDTSDETSDVDMLSPGSEDWNIYDLDEFERWASQQNSGGQVSQPERRLESTRLIDTFSSDELHDMKRAADFLFSLTFDEDCCALYVLMLKRLKDSPNQPMWITCSAVIACARSAYTTSQVEIAQYLLEHKLEELEGTASHVENFLYRMLLSYTYTRCGDDDNANLQIETAMGSDLADERLFEYLPKENRSLDILTYYFLNCGLGKHDDLVKEKTLKYLPEDHIFLDKSDAQDRLLQREPGPFELKDGYMKNPCIRSCLRWCLSEFEIIATIPGSWKHLQSDDQHLDWAERIGIYCCLWGRWQNFRGKASQPELLLWASQAEKCMGIAPAELLITLCWMIMSASPPRHDKSERDLFLRARLGARSLSQRTDEALASQFLDKFSWMNTMIRFSCEREAFRDVARAYAKDFIERSLQIKLPDEQDSDSNSESYACNTVDTPPQSNTPRRSLSIAAAVLLPTVASSMHSSDLSSFRALGDRIQQRIRGAMREIAMTEPSSVFRNSSKSNLSMQMSELSQAMASSLSLSSVKQAGTQAIETLATVSSNVRSRVAQLEGNPVVESMKRLL
jgi:hypothetical protein